MEENYLLAKKLVSNRFNTDYPYYALLVVSLYVLLCKYNDNKELVIEMFNTTDIYIEEDSMINIVKKHDIKMIDFEDEDLETSCCETYGISSHGNSYSITSDGVIVADKSNPFIICSVYNNDLESNINTFIHEANHLIKAIINAYEELDDDDQTIGYSIRSGISIHQYKYEPSTDILYEIDYFNIIDEVINTLQTTEMTENVLTLDGIVPDREIQEFIDSLDKNKLSKHYGYGLCTKLFIPLWANDIFKSIFEDNIVDGNIALIIDCFDKVMGEGAFETMADIMDDLDEAYFHGKNGKAVEKLKMNLKNIVKKYNKKTNFVYRK